MNIKNKELASFGAHKIVFNDSFMFGGNQIKIKTGLYDLQHIEFALAPDTEVDAGKINLKRLAEDKYVFSLNNKSVGAPAGFSCANFHILTTEIEGDAANETHLHGHVHYKYLDASRNDLSQLTLTLFELVVAKKAADPLTVDVEAD